MGLSNDERANAVADFFRQAGQQVSRANGITAQSKIDVKDRAATVRQAKSTAAQQKRLAKAGVHYLKGQSPAETMSATPTCHEGFRERRCESGVRGQRRRGGR
jgi:hypothetical protein